MRSFLLVTELPLENKLINLNIINTLAKTPFVQNIMLIDLS